MCGWWVVPFKKHTRDLGVLEVYLRFGPLLRWCFISIHPKSTVSLKVPYFHIKTGAKNSISLQTCAHSLAGWKLNVQKNNAHKKRVNFTGPCINFLHDKFVSRIKKKKITNTNAWSMNNKPRTLWLNVGSCWNSPVSNLMLKSSTTWNHDYIRKMFCDNLG